MIPLVGISIDEKIMGRGKHDYYLDELISKLDYIDEDRYEVQYILKNLIYTPNNQIQSSSMCDLILVYDTHAVPIELKGSEKKRKKAISQLTYGKEFIEYELNKEIYCGKFVIYGNDHYKTEIFDVSLLKG